jgi:hypothetical protein
MVGSSAGPLYHWTMKLWLQVAADVVSSSACQVNGSDTDRFRVGDLEAVTDLCVLCSMS